MKLLTAFKFRMTFEYWRAVVSGSTQSYQKVDDLRGSLLPSGGGFALYCHRQLPIGAQIRNAYDRRGNPILEVDGAPVYLYVNQADPQFDIYGTLVGWRHVLKREPSRTVNQIVDTFAERFPRT